MEPRHAHLFGVLGLALGTAALGNVWREAARLWRLGAWVNRVSDPLCGGLAVAVLGGWVVGVVWEAHAGRAPFSRPNLLALPLWAGLAVGAMAVTALSVTAAIVSPELAAGLWYAGLALQLAVLGGAAAAALVGGCRRREDRRAILTAADFTPLLYPITVGIGMLPTAAQVAVHPKSTAIDTLDDVLAWAAVVITFALTGPVAVQLLRNLSLEGGEAQLAVPSAVVQMAPFGLAFMGYDSAGLTGSGDPSGALTVMLVAGSLLSSALILLYLPYLVRMSFAPTWSALTFPLVASTHVMVRYRSLDSHDTVAAQLAFGVVAATYLAVSSAVVALVWVRLVIYLVGRAFSASGTAVLSATLEPEEPTSLGRESPL